MRRGKELGKELKGQIFQYLWGCKEISHWGGNGKERGHKGPESIYHFNKQIDKEIYPLLPSLSP